MDKLRDYYRLCGVHPIDEKPKPILSRLDEKEVKVLFGEEFTAYINKSNGVMKIENPIAGGGASGDVGPGFDEIMSNEVDGGASTEFIVI